MRVGAKWWTACRVLIGLLLLAYVIRSIDEQRLLTLLGQSVRERWPWWLAALFATYLGLHCGVIRWHGLLRVNDIAVSFRSVFRHFFVGQFFNAFMLGACGGDMARALAITHSCPERRASAISTVVIDRGIGLLVTVVVGCGAVLFRLPLFDISRTNRTAALLMFLFLGGSCAGLLALFSRHLFENWAFFRRMEQTSRLGPLIRKAYDAFYFYRHHPAALLQASLLSVLNLLALTLACYLAGVALQTSVAFRDCLTFFPIITVLAAIPITPGSLGLRENLFMAMFASVGMSPEAAVSLSLAVYVTGLFWSLLGGMFFIVGSNVCIGLKSKQSECA